jgi:hypothetical protein
MKATERMPVTSAGLEAGALIEQARRRKRRRRWVIAVAVAAVFAVVLAFMATGGGGTGGRVVARGGKHPAGAGTVGKLGVRWQAKVPAGVLSITTAYGSLWVTGIGAVTRMDPASGQVTARIPTPRTTDLSDAVGLDGKIWVSSGGFGGRSADLLYEIDPATNRVSRTVSVPGQPSAMTAGAGYLWVDVYRNSRELRPFDPRTGTFLRPVVTEMEMLGQPVYGLGSVWVTSALPWGRVWKIDPATMRASVLLQTASAPGQPLYSVGGPDGVTTAAGSVWLGFLNATEIARVNPATGALEQQLFVTKTIGTLLQGTPGEVWVLFQTGSSSPNIYLPDRSQPGRVGRISPQANAFVGADFKIGDSGGYDSLAISPAMAWVGDLLNSTVTAIGNAGSAGNRRARNR